MMERNHESTPDALPFPSMPHPAKGTPSRPEQAPQAQPAPRIQEQVRKPLPPGWGIAMFPEPPHGLDIVAPDGRILVTVRPGKPRGSRTNPGSWPEGTRWESWFKTPSGRRCRFASHIWKKNEWRRMDEEILAFPRIQIDADWGGVFAWAQYRQAMPLEGFFGDTPGLGALEATFQEWQGRFESTAPWGDALEPKGGWEQFSEDGLALCRDLATWVGPDGYVLYYHAPGRLGVRGKGLLLTWDPEAVPPRQAASICDPCPMPKGSTGNLAPRLGRR